MATKRIPGRTRRESYSTPATDAFPLCERTSAPTRSCSKVIGLIIDLAGSKAFPCAPRGTSVSPVVQAFRVNHGGKQENEDSFSEAHRNPRPRRDARSSLRRLFAGQPAADRIQVKP